MAWELRGWGYGIMGDGDDGKGREQMRAAGSIVC